MQETWILDHPFETLGVVLLFVFLLSAIAYRRGFFQLPHYSSYGSVSFWMLLLGFFCYFLFYLTLVPFAHTVQALVAMMQLVGLLMLLFTRLFGKERFLSLWNQGRRGALALLRSIGIGSLTYWIAIPWVALVSMSSVFLLTYWMGEMPPQVDQDAIRFLKSTLSNPTLFLNTAVAIVLFIPLAEEILFRGLLQNYLRSLFGPVFAIAITSFFFAMMHYSGAQGLSNVQIVSSLFALSLFLGFLYEREKTLLAPLALHATFNLVTVLVLSYFFNEI